MVGSESEGCQSKVEKCKGAKDISDAIGAIGEGRCNLRNRAIAIGGDSPMHQMKKNAMRYCAGRLIILVINGGDGFISCSDGETYPFMETQCFNQT